MFAHMHLGTYFILVLGVRVKCYILVNNHMSVHNGIQYQWTKREGSNNEGDTLYEVASLLC